MSLPSPSPESPQKSKHTDQMAQLTPPSPMDESDPHKYGKKREREVSAEPSTIDASTEVLDTVATDNQPRLSDLAAPTKKNKLEPASPTDSEGSGPTTPPRRTPPLPSAMTPKHESKVKQIRQQVRDMTWQDPLSQGSSISAEPTVILEEPQEDDNEIVEGGVSSKSDKDSDIQEEDLEKGVLETSPPPKIKDKVAHSGVQKDPNGESVKRPREDPDVDDNPRETKRPSPPPAKEPIKESPAASTSTSTATAPTSGFLSFASTTSPFGQAKAGSPAWSASPNSISTDFGSTSTPPVERKLSPAFIPTASPKESSESPAPSDKPKPLFGVTSAPTFTGFSSLKPAFGTTTAIQQKPLDKASRAAGPKRSKSPTHGVAFTPYNTNMRGFGVPKSSRRKRSPSPSGKSTGSPERSGPSSWSDNENAESALSFAERLREQDKDEPADGAANPRVDLQEQELITGEEDEEAVFSVRAKLYVLSDQKQWKERGTGPLKVNVRKDGETARIIMRKEGVHSLMLNVPLFKELKFEIAQDARYVRFAVPAKTSIEHYNLRCSTAKNVEDFLETVQAYLPE